MPKPLDRNANAFRSALIAWYDGHARDLPWRSETSLYRTVVSEFMLQQTQVKTATPYFHRWMEALPDFKSLAEASEETVLKLWEGLGYYTRARNLRLLAQQIAPLESAGAIPTRAADWLAFPGVGPYAASAICSIAFNDCSAVVDGNVVRILARLTADGASYQNSSEAAKRYRPLADELLNPDRPGDHNQAMMELGATVCQKHSPQCLICPVASFCLGREKGIEAELPRLAKTIFEERTVDRAWVVSPQGILLHRIPATAKRMKGLHELPELAQLGLSSNGAAPLAERKRSITRYRITERIFKTNASLLPADLAAANCIWATPAQIAELPFSGPHRRWITELLATS